MFLCCRRRRRRRRAAKPPQAVAAVARGGPTEGGTSSSKDDITGSVEAAERNKLVFMEGGVYGFGLEDLLRASKKVENGGLANSATK